MSVTFEATVQVRDAAKGALSATASGKDKGVRSAARSADGKTLTTCGEDKGVKLWDLGTGP